MRYAVLLATILCVTWFLTPEQVSAACSTQEVQLQGNHIRYSNDCTEDNEELIVTGDLSSYDVCSLVSATGAVDVVVSVDNGATYTTAPLSLTDKGASDLVPVIVTAALRLYAFPVLFTHLKVLQNGAADADATLRCMNLY